MNHWCIERVHMTELSQFRGPDGPRVEDDSGIERHRPLAHERQRRGHIVMMLTVIECGRVFDRAGGQVAMDEGLAGRLGVCMRSWDDARVQKRDDREQ